MTVDLPGHAAATGSLEVPLEMLTACHLRMASQNETLHQLAIHLRAHGSDRQARDASVVVMRCFDTGRAMRRRRGVDDADADSGHDRTGVAP